MKTIESDFATIMADIPIETKPRKKRPWNNVDRPNGKDLRPMIILGVVLVYSVTLIIGAVTVVIVNINGNAVARACIERGYEWVIADDGQRQCVRGR